MSKNITKRWLTKHGACITAYEIFCNQKERDEIKIIRKCMKIDRFDWANWLIVRRMRYKQYVRYAVYAAKQTLNLYEGKYPNDDRPRKAIEAAEKCIKNPSKKNKSAAGAAYDVGAAYAAANAAGAAYAAAGAAYDVGAAYAAANAAGAAGAAADAAGAAYAAAYAAANAAGAAADAAGAANAADAADAATNAADAANARRKLQKKIINYGIRLLREKNKNGKKK